jgi:hypothetical protein
MAQQILSDTMPHCRHQDSSTKITRGRYGSLFIELFSIPGLYREITTRLGAALGNRIRDGYPFNTRNMEIFHVAIWLHDHGLSPSSTEVRQLKTWALHVRAINETHSEDGNWPLFPRSLAIFVADHQQQLSVLPLSFSYPPRVPSAAPRSWTTIAELFVANNHRLNNLEPIILGVSINDEEPEEDMPPVEMPPSDPSAN